VDHSTADGRTLRLRLDVQLDCEPICGRLYTDEGEEEQFVGWLGFVDALRNMQELREHDDTNEEAGPA
jgi:hypothetical protein